MRERHFQRPWQIFVNMVSSRYACVNTCQVSHFKHEQPIVCQLYLKIIPIKQNGCLYVQRMSSGDSLLGASSWSIRLFFFFKAPSLFLTMQSCRIVIILAKWKTIAMTYHRERHKHIFFREHSWEWVQETTNPFWHSLACIITESIKVPFEILPWMKIFLCLNEAPRIPKCCFKAVVMDGVYHQHTSWPSLSLLILMWKQLE